MSGITDLPVEILENVFSQVPILDLTKNCICVCKLWHKIINNPKFLIWKKTYHKLKNGSETTSEKMEKILQDEGFIDDIEMLPVTVAEYMKDFRPLKRDSSLLSSLTKHRKYGLIRSFLDASSTNIKKNPWSVLSLLCLVSESVRDISQIIYLMLQEQSCLSYDILEALYLLASIFWFLKSQNRINSGIHYRIKYACFLYENKQNAPTHGDTRNSLQPTYEQEAIIKHDIKPREIVKIVAFAGTGKTTTLVKFTQRHPHMNVLNLCYNKSIQIQAEKLFPGNVENRTWHSLAYRKFGYKYKAKLCGSLGVQNITRCLEGETTFLHARRIQEALKTFISSSRISISTEDVVDSALSEDQETNKKYNSREYKQRVVADAQKCWRKMVDLNDKSLYMTHDGYLKLYQLSEPWLNMYDCILIDEAQDCTPVNASILRSQNCAKILVGDPYQQIYSFRGANNIMDEIHCTTTFYLTQSFRFGPEIGYVANSLLECLKNLHSKTLMGNSRPGTYLGERSGQLAIICRTNFCLFSEAVRICESGNRIAFAGGLKSYGLDRILNIYNLKYKLDVVNDPFLKLFTYKQLCQYAREAADKELLGKIGIVEFYKFAVPSHIDAIRKLAVEDMDNAGIVFSTVHKAKGLEFDTVRLGDDFIRESIVHDAKVENREDEKNMLYVAVTRAKRSIQINNTVKKVLELNKEYFLQLTVPNKELAKTTDPTECIYCHDYIHLDPLPHMIVERLKFTEFVAGQRVESDRGFLCVLCAKEKAPHFGCFTDPALPANRRKTKTQYDVQKHLGQEGEY